MSKYTQSDTNIDGLMMVLRMQGCNMQVRFFVTCSIFITCRNCSSSTCSSNNNQKAGSKKPWDECHKYAYINSGSWSSQASNAPFLFSCYLSFFLSILGMFACLGPYDDTSGPATYEIMLISEVFE